MVYRFTWGRIRGKEREDRYQVDRNVKRYQDLERSSTALLVLPDLPEIHLMETLFVVNGNAF